MADLLPPQPGKPGRKQTVTASAWIDRDKRNTPFTSCVSLGKGRIYRLSSQTTNRAKALAFNRCHLLNLLGKPKQKRNATSAEQILMEMM